MMTMKELCILISTVTLFGCSTERQLMKEARKVSHQDITISSPEGELKFETTNDLEPKLKPKMDRWYYWYAPHELHKTAGGFSGRLLQGNYTEHYTDGSIKEQGQFNKGLKYGEWRQWYTNGQLKEVADYKLGEKHGDYKSFDQKGNVMIQGVFKRGTYSGLKKSGWKKFVDFITFKKMRGSDESN